MMKKIIFGVVFFILSALVSADEFFGKTSLISNGSKQLDNGNCSWNRSRDVTLKVLKSDELESMIYIDYSTTDTIETDNTGNCSGGAGTYTGQYSFPIEFNGNSFYGKRIVTSETYTRTTIVEGSLANNTLTGTYSHSQNYISSQGNPGTSSDSGAFSLPLSQVHSLGSVDFVSTGTKTLQSGTCAWNRNRAVNFKIKYENSTPYAQIVYEQNDTPQVASNICVNHSKSNAFDFEITVGETEFYGNNNKGTIVQGKLVNDNQFEGTYTYDYSKNVTFSGESDTYIMLDSGSFTLTLDSNWKSILGIESSATTTPEPTTEPTPIPTATPEPTSEPTPIPTITSTPIPAPVANVTVENNIGSAIVATSISVDTTHDNVPTASAVVTDGDDEITLVDEDNTQVTIKPNTLVTQHPKQVVDDTLTKKTTLLRGDLELQVPASTREYVVVTPLGRFVVSSQSNTKRNDSNTDFNVSYNQEGFNGSVHVQVISGSVEFYDRNDVKHTLTSGTDQTLSNMVHRSNWVLPIDGDFIYGGRENTLSWLTYPGAVGYLLEYTFPSPHFAEENPNTPEFMNKSIYFYPSQYTVWQDLVILPLIIPDLPGQIVEARIFPIDASGSVIGNSFSSDKGTYTFK